METSIFWLLVSDPCWMGSQQVAPLCFVCVPVPGPDKGQTADNTTLQGRLLLLACSLFFDHLQSCSWGLPKFDTLDAGMCSVPASLITSMSSLAISAKTLFKHIPAQSMQEPSTSFNFAESQKNVLVYLNTARTSTAQGKCKAAGTIDAFTNLAKDTVTSWHYPWFHQRMPFSEKTVLNTCRAIGMMIFFILINQICSCDTGLCFCWKCEEY